ncbi:MAG: ATP-dependent nuclease [Alphaproteobacteria bacterium]
MVKISEIKITDDKGFFADKDFAWQEIQPFSIITGINGSGKTKLLDYIHGSKEYQSKNLIRYIDVNYRSPDKKYANEIANGFTHKLENSDEKCIAVHKENNTSQDLTNDKTWFNANKLFSQLDYSIIHGIIEERIKFQNNISALRKELDKAEAYQQTFNINDLLPANKDDEQPWDRIDRILHSFGLLIRVDRMYLASGLKFLRFLPSKLDETGLDMKDLSSGERGAFALALWTWGNSSRQKTDVLLVDEFDAHLNPSIAEKFIAVIKEYFVDLGVQVIMTTHNPSTVAFGKDLGADIVWMSDGQIDKDIEYREIIQVLSSGLLDINQLAEEAEFLVKNKKSFVVFTEGRIDAEYINIAIRALERKEDFKPIHIFPCTSASTIPKFIKIPFGHSKSIALFDTDNGKKYAQIIIDDPELKNKITKNDIVVMYISDEDNKTIEDLFDESLRAKGKEGLRKFVRKSENQTKENFAAFAALLDEIVNAFGKTQLQSVA